MRAGTRWYGTPSERPVEASASAPGNRSFPARLLVIIATLALIGGLLPASIVLANPNLDDNKCAAGVADPDLTAAGFACYNLYNKGQAQKGREQVVGQYYLKQDAAGLTIKVFTAANQFEGGKLCLDDDPDPISSFGQSCEGNPAGAEKVSQTSVIDCTAPHEEPSPGSQFEFYVDPLTATSVAATATVGAHQQVVLPNVDESCDEVLIHFNSGPFSILGYGQPTPAPPDVSVAKTPDGEGEAPGSVSAGDDAVFTIVVTNNGPGPADDVELEDTLPNSGLTWTVGGDDAAACSILAGVLTCDFGTLADGDTATITLTSPTTSADCGTIQNTVTITATGDITSGGNNDDDGSINVICGAIKILKNSTKGGAVATEGATFSIVGPDAPTADVEDNDANDQDTATGVVCVSGLQPGESYTVNETAAPTGYGDAPSSQADQAIFAEAAACGDLDVGATATFTNAPLGEFTITYTDLGSGETTAKIVCDGLTPVGGDGTPTDFDDLEETYTDLPGGDPAIEYDCTIAIDP